MCTLVHNLTGHGSDRIGSDVWECVAPFFFNFTSHRSFRLNFCFDRMLKLLSFITSRDRLKNYLDFSFRNGFFLLFWSFVTRERSKSIYSIASICFLGLFRIEFVHDRERERAHSRTRTSSVRKSLKKKKQKQKTTPKNNKAEYFKQIGLVFGCVNGNVNKMPLFELHLTSMLFGSAHHNSCFDHTI